jgi:hypothetical protein
MALELNLSRNQMRVSPKTGLKLTVSDLKIRGSPEFKSRCLTSLSNKYACFYFNFFCALVQFGRGPGFGGLRSTILAAQGFFFTSYSAFTISASGFRTLQRPTGDNCMS